MIVEANKDFILSYYDGITSLSNAREHDKNRELWRSYLSRAISAGSGWLGVPTLSELKEVSEVYGWMEGYTKGVELLKTIEIPKLPALRRKRVRSNHGYALDIVRVYSGNLSTAWKGFVKAAHTVSLRGNVTILIDTNLNANVSPEEHFWKGCTGIAIANALISSGRTVRILAVNSTIDWVVSDSYGSRSNFPRLCCQALLVKDYAQPLNPERVFAYTALAGFTRFYLFKGQVSLPYACPQGFGRAYRVNVEHYGSLLDNSVPILIENISSRKSALDRIENFKKSIELDISLGTDEN